MVPLSHQQQRLLNFLSTHISEHETAPTYREIAAAMGWASTRTVSQALGELEQLGRIRREPNKVRSLKVLDQSHKSGMVHLAGTIAAGSPIEALEQQEWIDLPDFLAGGEGSQVYALRVRGDSMKDDGILDGDIVLIERRTFASNGEVVVALIDGEEATLKRFSLEGSTVVLTPANSEHSPMRYPAHRVQIQGVLAGQARSYRRRSR